MEKSTSPIWVKLELYRFTTVMGPKDANGMANSVDTNQNALEEHLEEQSDQGLHCLPRPVCPKT